MRLQCYEVLSFWQSCSQLAEVPVSSCQCARNQQFHCNLPSHKMEQLGISFDGAPESRSLCGIEVIKIFASDQRYPVLRDVRASSPQQIRRVRRRRRAQGGQQTSSRWHDLPSSATLSDPRTFQIIPPHSVIDQDTDGRQHKSYWSWDQTLLQKLQRPKLNLHQRKGTCTSLYLHLCSHWFFSLLSCLSTIPTNWKKNRQPHNTTHWQRRFQKAPQNIGQIPWTDTFCRLQLKPDASIHFEPMELRACQLWLIQIKQPVRALVLETSTMLRRCARAQGFCLSLLIVSCRKLGDEKHKAQSSEDRILASAAAKVLC